MALDDVEIFDGQGVRVLLDIGDFLKNKDCELEGGQLRAIQHEGKSVTAVVQTPEDIRITIKLGGNPYFMLYYAAVGNDFAVYNQSSNDIDLRSGSTSIRLQDWKHCSVGPGTWDAMFGKVLLFQFRILTRRPLTAKPVASISDRKRKDTELDDILLLPDLRRLRLATDLTQGELSYDTSSLKKNQQALEDESKNHEQALEKESVREPLALLHKKESIRIPGVPGHSSYQRTKGADIVTRPPTHVCVAFHSKLGVCLVVKTLRSSRGEGANVENQIVHAADSWLREFNMHRNLEHDSIVKLLGADSRYLHLYLEYVPDADLSHRGKWCTDRYMFKGDKEDVLCIWLGIGRALQYLHEEHFLRHNDIKPGNILYSKERGPTLIDFGLTSPIQEHPKSSGTPWYIPPEYEYGRRDQNADVWALSVVLLFLWKMISLPECYSADGLDWLICDVYPRKDEVAIAKMDTWVSIIRSVNKRLDNAEHSKLLVGMLQDRPEPRIPVSAVVTGLKSIQEGDGTNAPPLQHALAMPASPSGSTEPWSSWEERELRFQFTSNTEAGQ